LTGAGFILWQLELTAGVLCVVAAAMGVVAHYLHPDLAPWHGMLSLVAAFGAIVLGVTVVASMF
jgi:hypothetical protein